MAAICLGILALVSVADAWARPASPPRPSWRITPPPPKAPPTSQQKKAGARGWQTSAEPVSTAALADSAVPLPMRKPADVALQSATPAEAENTTAPDMNVSAAVAKEPPAGSAEVVTTEVLGDEDHQRENAPTLGNAISAKRYCDNIANAAADARFAWQKKALLQTEQDVAKRIEELNTKIAEYRKWLARRDEFAHKAQKAVVDIYSKMKPDAAAQQLTVLDEEMAAAVITKLEPRVASAVMNEMETKRAARLTAIIAGAITGPSNNAPFTEPMATEAAAKGKAP